MKNKIKEINFVRKLRKTRLYCRLRQYFPMASPKFEEDFDFIDEQAPDNVKIDWPENAKKPHFGIVKDVGKYPRWTKYIHFLKQNNFSYDIFHIHKSDWIQQGSKFDIIVNFTSNDPCMLHEIRRKFGFLESHMGKFCYPSTEHINLYEDKQLEAFLAEYYGFPFAKTYIYCNKTEALKSIEFLNYPLVSKIASSSGSVGVELVPNVKVCRKLVNQSFSQMGRKTHLVYSRQKNYVYLQEYIPNDGYDLRAIVIGSKGFGYYRKVPEGDFRASGMHIEEMRDIPAKAMLIAYEMNKIIRSPQLVVDMVRAKNGKYYVIEYSPFSQVQTAAELEVNGERGVYIINEEDRSIQFDKRRYWAQELALREYLINDYLPIVMSEHHRKKD